MDTERIAENLKRVVESVRNAERKAGRKEGSVKLLAVSKFHPAEAVIAAIGAGQSAFGENRVQEAYEKFNKIYKDFPSTELHIIGTLQKNKAARAVRIASCIESVDRLGIMKSSKNSARRLINRSICYWNTTRAKRRKRAFFHTNSCTKRFAIVPKEMRRTSYRKVL